MVPTSVVPGATCENHTTQPHRQDDAGEVGRAVAASALQVLERPPRNYRSDCSGFVSAALQGAGVPLTGDTRTLWAFSESQGFVHYRHEPAVGDLVFFDNTWDRNGNGRFDDELTHVALVVSVDDSGTAILAHEGTTSGRSTLRMNLHHRHQPSVGQVQVNHPLRRRGRNDPEGTPYLASELWRGFATLDDDAVAGL